MHGLRFVSRGSPVRVGTGARVDLDEGYMHGHEPICYCSFPGLLQAGGVEPPEVFWID